MSRFNKEGKRLNGMARSALIAAGLRQHPVGRPRAARREHEDDPNTWSRTRLDRLVFRYGRYEPNNIAR